MLSQKRFRGLRSFAPAYWSLAADHSKLPKMGETPTPPPTDPGEAAAWIEFYYRQGWSDGLPLMPPTEASVARGAGRQRRRHRYDCRAQCHVARGEGRHQCRHGRLSAGVFSGAARRGAVSVPAGVPLPQPGHEHRRLGADPDRERNDIQDDPRLFPNVFPVYRVKNHSTSSGSISLSFRNERGITLYIIPKNFFAKGLRCAAEENEYLLLPLTLCSVRAYKW